MMKGLVGFLDGLSCGGANDVLYKSPMRIIAVPVNGSIAFLNDKSRNCCSHILSLR